MEDGWLINSALQEAIVNGTADVGREYMDINGFLEFVMKARKGEVELDILVVSVDPDAYVKMIPISTSNCYAYYREYTFRDDELVVRRSSGYIDSLATKQVTISDSRINEAYLAKISSYYPDWLVIVEDDEQADTPDTRRAVELQTMY
ncbi:hypothetical protein [Vibrio phage vB_VpaP_SJSY21]|nr:hypothetical protein [Vibrio phage vB_VpaP_SJSY21]